MSVRPTMLESVADNIKETGLQYTELFCSLDEDVMRKVSDLITDLNNKRPGGEDAKSRQPSSNHTVA